MLRELIIRNRSYRRFHEDVKITRVFLKGLIDMARLSASARNIQPLKYIISSEPEKNELIFPHLLWAGYLKEWPGPDKGERPSAYIIVLHDTEIETSSNLLWCDLGLACQNILLGAVEGGYGGCLMGAFKKDKIIKILHIPSRYDPLLVIALGKPNEIVRLEEIDEGQDIRYYRDERCVHHVPKRRLENLIIQ